MSTSTETAGAGLDWLKWIVVFAILGGGVFGNWYFGEQSLHQVLERAVWHSAQHARQLMMVLGLLDITPSAPLTEEDLADLPMPENVWDG